MLEYDEIRISLNGVKSELDELKNALGLEKNAREIAELELRSSEPNFWDDPKNSQTVLQRLRYLKNIEETYQKLVSLQEDTLTAIEIAEEMEDASLFDEIKNDSDTFFSELEKVKLTFNFMLIQYYSRYHLPFNNFFFNLINKKFFFFAMLLYLSNMYGDFARPS